VWGAAAKEAAMNAGNTIATVGLSGGEASFRLEALSWESEAPEKRLVVSIELRSSDGTWRSRAVTVMGEDLDGVAGAASSSLDSHNIRSGLLRYARHGGEPCLVFAFRLLPDGRRIEVSVEVDSSLEPEAPSCPVDRQDTVLLRVSSGQLSAFADALEQIARRDPSHVVWAGG
jgi:hypothetical protein